MGARFLSNLLLVIALGTWILRVYEVTGLIAYDCGDDNVDITAISLRNVARCPDPSSAYTSESVDATVFQRNDVGLQHVWSCFVEVTRLITYCGMHSHSSVVSGGLLTIFLKSVRKSAYKRDLESLYIDTIHRMCLLQREILKKRLLALVVPDAKHPPKELEVVSDARVNFQPIQPLGSKGLNTPEEIEKVQKLLTFGQERKVVENIINRRAAGMETGGQGFSTLGIFDPKEMKELTRTGTVYGPRTPDVVNEREELETIASDSNGLAKEQSAVAYPDLNTVPHLTEKLKN
ncbi:hypothetical protein NQ317_019946 [Molorchus minor]|uniref:Uncharacterized protein n=1 Tax=Molorchus minor TaxID=1323400 RepID=A0ABQ9JAC6_9CUCU|nr:hypothetical protein NQ317_019946 [Molorchus minor]